MMRRGAPASVPRSAIRKGSVSGADRRASALKPETSVKFNLPSSGSDQVKFQLSGFHEMPEFRAPVLPLPKPSSTYKPLNTKPGRSVPKFNVRDLPQGIDFNHELFTSEPFYTPDQALSVQRALALGAMKKKPSRAPKPTEAFMGQLRNDIEEMKNESGEGETFMSDANRIRRELLGVELDVRKRVEKDIGFGFRKKTVPNEPKSTGSPSMEQFLSKESVGKRTDKSIRALQEKIQQQRQEYHGLIGSRSPEGAQGGQVTGDKYYLKDPLVKKTQDLVSGKLADISTHFRETLKESTRELMRSARAKPGAESKKPAPSLRSLNETSHDQKKMTRSPEVKRGSESVLLTRPNAKFAPRHSKEKTNVDTSSKPPTKLAVPAKKKPVTQPEDDEIDFSGIIKLRSLLDANTTDLFGKRGKSVSAEGQAQPIEKAYPSISPAIRHREFEDSPRGFSFGQKPQKSVAFAVDVQTEPVDYNYGSGRKAGITQADLSAGRYPQIPTDVLKQKLGESVKSVEDAERVANALGSLMTRVAVARNINAPTVAPEFGRASASFGTMTDGPAGVRRPPQVPEIKFTKDMSAADQRQLRELRARAKHQDWSNVRISEA